MSAPALQSSEAELPTEIWHHIFRLATEVEGEFDPLLWSQKHAETPLQDLFTSSLYSIYIKSTCSAIETSFPTRCNVTAVSRRWRALGIMILYSSVTLKSHANMIAFLEQSARRDPQSGGLARYVKRITFGPSRFAKFEDSEWTMARILPLCKNLVILVDNGPASGPGQFPFPEFPPLVQCPNLQYIFGKNSIAPPSSPEPWKWLSSMKSLCAITLEIYESHFKYNTSCHTSSPTLRLPYLHTLQLADKGSAVALSVSTWDLPSLRNLVFTEENSNRAFCYILKAHGHKIEKLAFTRNSRQGNDESETDVDLSLPQLRFLSIPLHEPDELPFFTPLITSPNLEEVAFPINIWGLMPDGWDPCDHDALGEVDLGSLEGLLDILLNKRQTPSLQTVRFFEMNWYRPRIISYWLAELEEKFRERVVRLQIGMVGE